VCRHAIVACIPAFMCQATCAGSGAMYLIGYEIDKTPAGVHYAGVDKDGRLEFDIRVPLQEARSLPCEQHARSIGVAQIIRNGSGLLLSGGVDDAR